MGTLRGSGGGANERAVEVRLLWRGHGGGASSNLGFEQRAPSAAGRGLYAAVGHQKQAQISSAPRLLCMGSAKHCRAAQLPANHGAATAPDAPASPRMRHDKAHRTGGIQEMFSGGVNAAHRAGLVQQTDQVAAARELSLFVRLWRKDTVLQAKFQPWFDIIFCLSRFCCEYSSLPR